jgi:dienelactone hydrolase
MRAVSERARGTHIDATVRGGSTLWRGMTRRATRRRLLAAVGAVTTTFAGCTGGGASDSTGTTAPGTPTDAASPSDSPEPTGTASSSGPRDVTFQSAASTQVEGTLYGSGDCGVVLVPQINLDRESWEPLATALADRGYVALAIDEDPDERAASALGAARYLREVVGVDHLVLVGASSGGEAVVRATATAEQGTVDGLVTLSAGGGADVASDLQGRKLFTVAENDDDRFVRVAEQLHANAPRPKTLQRYAGSAHGQALFEAHGDDLRSRLFDLVATACGA